MNQRLSPEPKRGDGRVDVADVGGVVVRRVGVPQRVPRGYGRPVVATKDRVVHVDARRRAGSRRDGVEPRQSPLRPLGRGVVLPVQPQGSPPEIGLGSGQEVPHLVGDVAGTGEVIEPQPLAAAQGRLGLRAHARVGVPIALGALHDDEVRPQAGEVGLLLVRGDVNTVSMSWRRRRRRRGGRRGLGRRGLLGELRPLGQEPVAVETVAARPSPRAGVRVRGVGDGSGLNPGLIAQDTIV